MFLAGKASDDGSGIWCSKGTIQRHTELGETTVKRTVRAFLKEGVLVETGARTCKNGFTVVYRIDLSADSPDQCSIRRRFHCVLDVTGPYCIKEQIALIIKILQQLGDKTEVLKSKC